GGIIDIFPLGEENPVRIEFGEEKIVSMRLFDIETQRSVNKITEIEIHPAKEPEGKLKLYDYLTNRANGIINSLTSFWYIPDATLEVKHELKDKIKESLCSFLWIEINSSSFTNEKGIVTWHTRQITNFSSHIDTFFSELKRYRENKFIVFILCDNKGQNDRLIEIFEEKEINLSFLSIQLGNISQGFEFEEGKIAVIKDDEIFGRYEIKKKYPKFRKKGANLASFTELREQDYVVHVYHGIGKYLSIERLKIGGKEEDFIKIMYAGNDKIYVPVIKLNMVQKYIGDIDNPPELTTLGSISWAKNKERVKKAVEKIAKELVEIYAARHYLPGHSSSPDTQWQKEFENSFIYEETPDQLEVVQKVKEDMEKPKPMDRLICGDVGYGKTEVAIRACFKAVMDGRQAAVLVPTTILAQQHLKTFTERMADYPIKIDMLSRFRSKHEQKKIIEAVSYGKIDIIIGTHRLLQEDIKFKNIGLLVIDEEHRFGVKQKEKIKKIRNLIDVLSLTATPIPRTLQMSVIEVRDMSVIETPPRGRVPTKTFVTEFDKELIKNAILNEKNRGGQIFYVHNYVQTIEGAGLFIQELVPDIKIAIAHGQMHEKDLEKTMLDFMNKKYDCLVCTTIIESGLDIPNVNTIIIEQAENFGLAQLYQLKGRVGRCDRLAYAYLLYDNKEALSHTALKRLETIAEISELGAGFKIAMKDMEIRGAGNILGTDQHGHINIVGYDLYCELLKESIEKLKGKHKQEEINPEINLNLSNFLPDDYIRDNIQKITLYKRLASLQNEDELDEIKNELLDRYGKIPISVDNLLNIINIKILAAFAMITGIKETHDNRIILKFSNKNNLTREKIMQVYNKFQDCVTFVSSHFPEFNINTNMFKTEREKIELLKNILHILR
ncbi:MAG: transcription-repair coupling factor, partial [Candidatus Firestonebacteria bacterium]|nr:transcription-repair coupling factor [Candidatus Firestonebacteria bacterium]